jgi:hypothetical protein
VAIIVSTKLEVTFRAADFLVEAIDDFLESGTNPRKIGGSIIKIAVGAELLLKEKLERICPALILEEVGRGGLQIAKLYDLGAKMRQPAVLDNVELRTAPFGELLTRADLFLRMGRGRKYLEELYKLRNKLVHRSFTLDVHEANLLIINKVVPFLQQFTKDDPDMQVKIAPRTWKHLRIIANSSTDFVYAQFAKRVEQHRGRAARLSQRTVSEILSRPTTCAPNEELLGEALLCPACGHLSMIALAVEQEDRWVDDVFVHEDRGSVCKLCAFALDDEDVELYLDHLGDNSRRKKGEREEAVAERISSFHRSRVAARKLAPYDGGSRVPATIAAISDSVRWNIGRFPSTRSILADLLLP